MKNMIFSAQTHNVLLTFAKLLAICCPIWQPQSQGAEKRNTNSNQQDVSSDNVNVSSEINADVVPESDPPLETEDQSENLSVSDPFKDFMTIRNDACKFVLFVVLLFF